MPVPNPEAGDNRIPVTEASAEIGTDGRLRVRFRQRPGGRDRSEPPSLAEFVAALAPYRGGRMTAEQHAAVLAALAACGHDVRGPLAQGDGLHARKATLPARKVTVRPAQGDAFGGEATVFEGKATLLPAEPDNPVTPVNPPLPGAFPEPNPARKF